MLELIGVCNGSYTAKNGKTFFTFKVNGVVGEVRIAADYAKGAEYGRKYLIRLQPRKFEEKVFLTYSVLEEV